MKFVVYRHARESEQSDEWLMVSLIKKINTKTTMLCVGWSTSYAA